MPAVLDAMIALHGDRVGGLSPIPGAQHRVIRRNPRVQNAVGESADPVTVQSDHGV